MERILVMEKKIFKREKKEDKPVLAICYDFDKTLSPDDMQAQGYIQNVGYNVEEFWTESNELAQENDMDQNLAYMLKMVEKSHGKFYLTKESLADYGSKVELFEGVKDWFDRICSYGEEKGVIVEHYIISSGLKEMIEGTEMAKNNCFKKIYASSFIYDSGNVAIWPAQAINYTNKTQFLFRIEKGVLDINDEAVNDYFSPEEIRVPFRNMVYIGDSATDIPCMKLVNSYGGYSIGVYNPHKKDKSKVYEMMKEHRIRYFVPSIYTEESEIDILIKKIIDKTAKNEELEKIHYKNQREVEEHQEDRLKRKKRNIIYNLLNSGSFATTHTLIRESDEIDEWEQDEIEQLFEAAVTNGQIKSIIGDKDIYFFYKDLLEKYKGENDFADELKDLLN